MKPLDCWSQYLFIYLFILFIHIDFTWEHIQESTHQITHSVFECFTKSYTEFFKHPHTAFNLLETLSGSNNKSWGNYFVEYLQWTFLYNLIVIQFLLANEKTLLNLEKRSFESCVTKEKERFISKDFSFRDILLQQPNVIDFLRQIILAQWKWNESQTETF